MERERYTEKNMEYYTDRTAARAIENIKRKEEKAQLIEAVRECKKIMYNHGFEICGKIPVKNRRTGWIYR